MIPSHRRVVQLLEDGLTVDEVAVKTHYHPNTVRVVRRRYRWARMVALAELASLHPTEYNDLLERQLIA